jgi:hypothetical protein
MAPPFNGDRVVWMLSALLALLVLILFGVMLVR